MVASWKSVTPEPGPIFYVQWLVRREIFITTSTFWNFEKRSNVHDKTKQSLNTGHGRRNAIHQQTFVPVAR